MDEHQSDSDALASALGAIGAASQDPSPTHHFHHQLQAPDFSLGHQHGHHGQPSHHQQQHPHHPHGHVGVGVGVGQSKSPLHAEDPLHGLDPSSLEHLDHDALAHSTLDHHDDHSLVDVHALEMVVNDHHNQHHQHVGHDVGHGGHGEEEIDLNPPGDELDLNLGLGEQLEHQEGMGDMDQMGEMDQDDDLPQHQRMSHHFGRPPSIRKACDLCHAAKQKCSGDRPSCTRCAAGGWACVYAPRQRRRTVPKEHKLAMSMQMSTPPEHQSRSPPLSIPPPPQHHSHHVHQGQHGHGHGHGHGQPMKKRKMGSRDSLGGFGSGEMDMKMAMGMAVDLGLTGEEEGEEMMSMTDEQMLESIAIDGYLADLPLATFVHNLPFTAAPPPPEPQVNFNAEDFANSNDVAFPAGGVMDQHTTSALRDAIFSLNESNAGGAGQNDGTGEEGNEGGDGEDGEGMDPHLALLDLSHAMPGENETEQNNDSVNINYPHTPSGPTQCPHIPLVLHILHLLTSQTLEPKAGTNTPLTLSVFAPLSRSLRLFHALVQCPMCSSSPQQTLPQLALLSRTTTILTFPYPPISSSSVGSSAQITVHGARLSGTGLSEAIEQHIVGVVWDSWRAAIREIFANLERKAQEVISQSTAAASAAASGGGGGGGGGGDGSPGGGGGNGGGSAAPTGPETQRAGLMFQAMSRLVTAMDEVEDN